MTQTLSRTAQQPIPGKVLGQIINGRGAAWRAAFAQARAEGKTRYHAALIAESQHGSSFQRAVCQLALDEGRTGPATDPPARGHHHPRHTRQQES